MYWHPKYQMLLMVYVDDFKMAGPSKWMAEVWGLIRKNI